MSSGVIPKWLDSIQGAVTQQNGEQLRQLLPIEPPFHPDFQNLIREVSQSNEFAGDGATVSLKNFIESRLPLADYQASRDAWVALPDFLAEFLRFVRDVKVENLLETFERLSDLVVKCGSTLNNEKYDVLMIPTLLYYTKVLVRLAIGLEKQPQLIAHLTASEDDQTLPEQAASKLRSILGNCARDQRPNGKGVVVYKLVNLIMKMLFQCNRPESIRTFYPVVVIQHRSINDYPRSERVTYLYYLGKYFFTAGQFHSASQTLEAAYAECHVDFLKQRRLILIYLVAANIIHGRFPSKALYSRREAAGFQVRIEPLCRAISKGDLAAFRVLTAFDHEYASWFMYFGIFDQLRNRCEPLVYRSLARRTFAVHATGGTMTAAGEKTAPTLDLEDLTSVAYALELRAANPILRSKQAPGVRHTNWLFMQADEGSLPVPYVDPDFEGLDEEDIYPSHLLPDLMEVECIVAGLIETGLMKGFVSHKLGKFAVSGAKNRPALQAGWPPVAETLRERLGNQDVPGWKRSSGIMGGSVIQLTGAMAAGS
jgi:hypothetical protein